MSMTHPQHNGIMKRAAACVQKPNPTDLVIDFTENKTEWRLIVTPGHVGGTIQQMEETLASIEFALISRAANVQASNRYANDTERRIVAGVMEALSRAHIARAQFMSNQSVSLLSEMSWTCLNSDARPASLRKA